MLGSAENSDFEEIALAEQRMDADELHNKISNFSYFDKHYDISCRLITMKTPGIQLSSND